MEQDSDSEQWVVEVPQETLLSVQAAFTYRKASCQMMARFNRIEAQEEQEQEKDWQPVDAVQWEADLLSADIRTAQAFGPTLQQLININLRDSGTDYAWTQRRRDNSSTFEQIASDIFNGEHYPRHLVASCSDYFEVEIGLYITDLLTRRILRFRISWLYICVLLNCQEKSGISRYYRGTIRFCDQIGLL